MPARRTLVRAFVALYVTVGIVVLIQSLHLLLDARRGEFAGPERFHVAFLAVLEILAAILFLIPRTMQLGAGALLVIFAGAFAMHLFQGQPPWQVLVDAAAVWFVRAHGLDLGPGEKTSAAGA